MKDRSIKWKAACLTAAVLVLLTGCGKGGRSGEPAKEFVYVPSYIDLDLKCENLRSVEARGDTLYLQGSTWNEEGSADYLYIYDTVNEKLDEILLDIGEYSTFSEFTVDADGNIRAAVSTTVYDGETYEVESSALEIWTLDGATGAVLEKTDISEVMGVKTGVPAYIQYMCMDAQGNLYLADGETGIHVIDKEYRKVCDIAMDSWINSMSVSREGVVYVSYYGANGMEFKSVDPAAKALGQALPGVEGYNSTLYTASSKSFLVSSGDTVSLLDTETGIGEELFKWLDADLNSDYIVSAGEFSDGRVWAMMRDYGPRARSTGTGASNQNELVCLTRTKASEVPQKEELTYGAMWIESSVKSRIIDFNKTNDKYRITVEEFATDDYQEALTQFNAALTSGKCPDMIDLSYINFDMYASRGVFEDLSPYMEKSGINSENYLENVITAYSVDDKIYGITPQFYISSVLAKTSNVGDTSGWTLQEMLDFAEKYDPGDIFAYGNQSSALYSCLFYGNMDEFINWETGECSFKNDEFIRALNFAAEFPEEIDYNNEELQNFSKRIHDDKLVLMETSISSVQEYQMMRGMFGEEITFIGFPNAQRQGNLIMPVGGSMAISSKCKSKDGAWEFMETLLSEEYQMSLVEEQGSWGFPVNKKALDKQFEQDMTPEHYEDENGEKTEQAKTTWGFGDFQMEIYAATQEEVDEVKELIASADRLLGNVNQQISNIITEETEPFLKGQKSAEEVVEVIQNRVQIYVSENR